jgi:hypothetical protein
MDINHISQKITVFHGRIAPEEGMLAGQPHLRFQATNARINLIF